MPLRLGLALLALFTIRCGCTDDLVLDPAADPVSRVCAAIAHAEIERRALDEQGDHCADPFRTVMVEEWYAAFQAEVAVACAPGGRPYLRAKSLLREEEFTLDLDRLAECVQRGRTIRLGEARPDAVHKALDELVDGECGDVWRPTDRRPRGSACTSNLHCAEGLRCVAIPSDSNGLRCDTPSAAGDECGAARACRAGLRCENRRCVALGREGEPCPAPTSDCADGFFCSQGVCRARAGVGAPCESPLGCAAGLVCAGAPGGTLSCLAPRVVPRGGECIASAQCASPCDACLGPRGATPGVCGARGRSGQACEWSEQCAADLSCVDGRCASLPGPGAACVVDENGTDPCGPGTACREGACRARVGYGAECGPTIPCEDPWICNGTCRYHVGLGEACTGDGSCSFGECRSGMCALVAVGGTCDVDDDCAEGLACGTTEGKRTCVAPAPADSSCTADDQCAPEDRCGPEGRCLPRRPPGEACTVDADCASRECLSGGTCSARAPGGEGEGCALGLDLNGVFVYAFVFVPGLRRRRR